MHSFVFTHVSQDVKVNFQRMYNSNRGLKYHDHQDRDFKKTPQQEKKKIENRPWCGQFSVSLSAIHQHFKNTRVRLRSKVLENDGGGMKNPGEL